MAKEKEGRGGGQLVKGRLNIGADLVLMRAVGKSGGGKELPLSDRPPRAWVFNLGMGRATHKRDQQQLIPPGTPRASRTARDHG